MSQQLIYTSAPRGLKPGSRGFCTVATTPGMPANLADRLEALSAYRHIFPPGDPRNPVNYSFLTFTLGGRRLYVLSRVADAGLDYTQRTNKIAHHVVLEQNELPPAGPAALLMQPGFMETAWTGEPRTLAPRPVPAIQAPPRKCALWEQVTGDAGWGGYLAEPTDSRPGTPVILVYRHDMPVLALLTETMALLPPERRWQTTFSAYYTKLPPGLECQWRCVVEGSPEEQLVNRQREAVILQLRDLARAQEKAPAITAVIAARSGDSLPVAKAVAGQRIQDVAIKLKDEELEEALRGSEQRRSSGQSDRRGEVLIQNEYRLASPSPPVPSADILARSFPDDALMLRTQLAINRSRRWIWVAALCALVVIASGTTLTVFLVDREQEVAQAHNQRSTSEPDAKPPSQQPNDALDQKASPVELPPDKRPVITPDRPESPEQQQPTDSQPHPDSESRIENNAPSSSQPVASTQSDERPQTESNEQPKLNVAQTESTKAPKEPKGEHKRAEARLLNQLKPFVDLPPLTAPIVEDETEKQPLIEAKWTKVTDPTIALVGATDSLKAIDGVHFILTKGEDPSSFEVHMVDSRNQTYKIASISIAKLGIYFAWQKPAYKVESQASYLRNCALDIGLPGHNPRRVYLRSPKDARAIGFRDITVNLSGNKTTGALGISRVDEILYLPPHPQIHLAIHLPKFMGSLNDDSPGTEVQHEFRVPGPGENSVKVVFKANIDRHAALQVTSHYIGVDLRTNQVPDGRIKINEKNGLRELKAGHVTKILSDIRKSIEALNGEITSTKSQQLFKPEEAAKRISSIQSKIEEREAFLPPLQGLESLLNKMHLDAIVQWTVYLQVGDMKVPIATSDIQNLSTD